MSCLPHILLPYRHYVVVVVTEVLVGWLEQGGSWSQLVAAYGGDGTPAVRTMQRWLKAFEAEAARWVRAIWAEMAKQQPRSPWLKVRGPTHGSVGHKLLDMAVDWLAWAQQEWPVLKGLGVRDRLAFLGIWGSPRGLGRLL